MRFHAIEEVVAFKDVEALPALHVIARNDTGWGDGEPMSKRAEQAIRTLTQMQGNPVSNLAMGVGSVIREIGRSMFGVGSVIREIGRSMFGAGKDKEE
ncbi:MAG TPA: hypothetical protein VJ183_02030 [Chloroflexia bacterium]|nr:hypothetical protein [Chloroflexia bacterium]